MTEWLPPSRRENCTVEVVKYKGKNGAFGSIQTVYRPQRISKSGKVTSLLDFMSEGFGYTDMKYAKRTAEQEAIELGWPLVYIDETRTERDDAKRWQEIANRFDHAKTSDSQAVLDALGLADDPVRPLAEIIDNELKRRN